MLCIVLAVAAGIGAAHGGSRVPFGFEDEPIATGLHFCVGFDFLPDGRVVMVQQADSRVVMVRPGPPPLVLAMGQVDSVRFNGETGLLGIAVDPRWPAKPYLYMHMDYTGGPQVHIARYRVLGDLDGTGNGQLLLDSLSRYNVLVDLPDSSTFHNAGHVHFGPDSLLYLSLGDDVTYCGAQAVERLVGKILRIEVRNLPDGPGGPPTMESITPPDNPFVSHPDPRARLVWAFGLRNPFSFSVDPSGLVTIGDVGLGFAEEINLATKGGDNFGWPVYEGFHERMPCGNADTLTYPPVAPIYDYPRPENGSPIAVMTAGIYRPREGGEHNFPAEYDGSIFFSDVYVGFLRRLVNDESGWHLAAPVPGQPTVTDWGRNFDGVTSYAIGPDGALWYAKFSEQYASFTGELRRIRPGTYRLDVPTPSGDAVRLEAPVPSPARERARLAWTLDRPGAVTLEAFDLAGARVRRIVPGSEFTAGRHEAVWNLDDDSGRRARPGLYYLKLSTTHGRAVRPLIVVR